MLLATSVCVIIFSTCKAAGQGSLPKHHWRLNSRSKQQQLYQYTSEGQLCPLWSELSRSESHREVLWRRINSRYVSLCSEDQTSRLYPSFLDPNSSAAEVITGVNFATAGAGNEYETNTLLNAIRVPHQIDKFRDCIDRS